MARCEYCSKFCAVELEVRSAQAELDDDKSILVSAELVLNSECCSAEVGTAQPEGTFPIEIEHKEGCEQDFDVEVLDYSETDRYQTTNARTGKPVPPRYQKHFYGAEVTVKISCEACDAEEEQTVTVEEAASNFDTY